MINTWARKILGIILELDQGKSLKIDQSTRKLMTMYEALHLRDDVDRLYVSRKERGRGLFSIAESFGSWLQ